MGFEFVVTPGYFQSLNQLDHQSQKQVKLAVEDFQRDLVLFSQPAPGLRFHKLSHCKTDGLWSISCNMDLRVILYQKNHTYVYLHVNHHDQAYQWARNRSLKMDYSGARIQMFELLDDGVVEARKAKAGQETCPFAGLEAEKLQAYGVPEPLWDYVRSLPESALLEMIDHLPEDAADHLLRHYSGDMLPEAPALQGLPVRIEDPQVEHALRHELQGWMVFLHPAQQVLVQASPRGSIRVTGGPGTGKTVVALHRAAHLARQNPDARILLTSYSRTLAERLEEQLPDVIAPTEKGFRCIEVLNVHKMAKELLSESVNFVNADQVKSLLMEVHQQSPGRFGFDFVWTEWQQVIEAQGLWTFEGYRKAHRTGRGTPLGAMQRKELWGLYQQVLDTLTRQGFITFTHILTRSAREMQARGKTYYDHVIADEAQDLGPAELEFLRALVKPGPSDLTLLGDPQQRIFKAVNTWLEHGIDIRNSSYRLNINYRTTREIQQFAEQVLEQQKDITLTSMHGPVPEVKVCQDDQQQVEAISNFIAGVLAAGHRPCEVVILERASHLPLASRVAQHLNLPIFDLENKGELPQGHLAGCSLHRAKGLEFRTVVIANAGKSHLPSPSLLKLALDEADTNRIVQMERQLLYVGVTRAREHLLITCTGDLSPLLP